MAPYLPQADLQGARLSSIVQLEPWTREPVSGKKGKPAMHGLSAYVNTEELP